MSLYLRGAGVILTISVLLAGTARAQHAAVVSPCEPQASPRSEPERRHRVPESPMTIFTNLSSKATERRRLAYRQLGIDSSLESLDVDDVRLEMVNLDADDDAEAILIYTIGRRLTSAVVFDRSKDGWWQVGAFDYSWAWNSDSAERLIGLKEIVWPRRKDLVVQQQSGGTGVMRTDVAVYRMYNGALYRVFNTTESWEYDAVGQPRISAYLEKRDVTFYDEDTAGRPSIRVQYTKTAYPAEASAKPKTEALSCAGYAWDAVRFEFLPEPAITRKLCGADAKVAC